MSFRLFLYYCALCGAWAAFLGWAAGLLLAPGKLDMTDTERIVQATTKGMLVGLFVAMGLILIDSLWNLSFKQIGPVLVRVGVSLLIGGLGGMLGGIIGQALVNAVRFSPLLILGWTLTGLLIGAS